MRFLATPPATPTSPTVLTRSLATPLAATTLGKNVEGSENTATGYGALFYNTAIRNSAFGTFALFSNTTGKFNSGFGYGALGSNTTGQNNTATGYGALVSNTTGGGNTANGTEALSTNTTGSANTANGFNALARNTTGFDNTANGTNALINNITGNNNIALGANAAAILIRGDFNIDIGNLGNRVEDRTIRIGSIQTQTFIAGISGAAVTGTAVVVDGSGQLGVAPSSKRFKEEIKPMGNESETILALKPVKFHYKKEIDPAGTPQLGLVAEDVEKVNPDLIVRDKEGKPYTVRYDQVNAMLLNEFLKEHRKVEGQQKEIDALKAELREQKALIQKVSAQLEVSKFATGRIRRGGPASHVAENNQ